MVFVKIALAGCAAPRRARSGGGAGDGFSIVDVDILATGYVWSSSSRSFPETERRVPAGPWMRLVEIGLG